MLAAALAAVFAFGACARQAPKQAASQRYALLKTSKGAIMVRLFMDKAPRTTAHFIGLASGKKAWRDPRDGKTKQEPLYHGVLFHRVIPGFMIQTGDPRGDGRGGIGYEIDDEFDPSLSYDRPGLLGMANAGPNTNGGQFFITLAPTPHLNGHHTIFGEVVRGLEVAHAIAAVPRDQSDGSDRPLDPVFLESVTLADKLP
ncbi:MAG: peptidylprolyl isomerase [Elusimicrobia bacterium]|nr:peptidylprolyl isomerase [Elusimicrobiota bacterium]